MTKLYTLYICMYVQACMHVPVYVGGCMRTYGRVHDCICVGVYGPVNNKVMSSRSVNSGTVPGQA